MSKDDETVNLLKELVKWTKVTNIPKVKKILLETLPSPEEKVAYELSDGRSSDKIAKKVGVSSMTITRWWKKWINIGIAESISARGGQRAEKTFSLEDFDIEIPKVKIPTSKK